MNLGKLFVREIRHRRVGFVLGLTAVAVAVGGLVGACGFLRGHDLETGRLVAELEKRAGERMASLRNDARVFSKSLGFNILILPAEQDPTLLYTRDRSTHFFSPADAAALAAAKPKTLNHLLPMLRERVSWERYGGEVVLVGIEGEIYIKAPGFQKPIEEAIAAGKVHLGSAVAGKLGVAEGGEVELLGERFTVSRLLPPKGNIDDVTILMNLADAQRVLKREGKIGGILALSCNCAAGALSPIRRDVHKVLPGAQVVEFTVRARARQRAREAIAAGTRAEIADIRESRGALRRQLAAFAGLFVALVAASTVVLLVVLTVNNTRERRVEVAMLRALGLSSGRILAMFLLKAALTGAAGGLFGCIAGLAIGEWVAGASPVSASFALSVLLAAPVVTTLACGVPALRAADLDPAVILNQE